MKKLLSVYSVLLLMFVAFISPIYAQYGGAISSIGGGWGGSQSLLDRDVCPDGDTSGSYYDGECGDDDMMDEDDDTVETNNDDDMMDDDDTMEDHSDNDHSDNDHSDDMMDDEDEDTTSSILDIIKNNQGSGTPSTTTTNTNNAGNTGFTVPSTLAPTGADVTLL